MVEKQTNSSSTTVYEGDENFYSLATIIMKIMKHYVTVSFFL